MKRNLIIILIAALTVVIGFVYFTKDEVTFSRETSVYKAVPVSTPLFIEFSSIQSIPVENPIVQEFVKSEIWNEFFELIEKLDTIIQYKKDIQNNLRNEPFILAFNFTGKNELVPIVIKKADSNNKRKTLENLIQVLFPFDEYLYDKRNYNGHRITTISTSANSNTLFYCFTGGLFLTSTNSILLEQSIRQINTQGIVENPFFLKANKTVTSQSEISLYVNHVYFPEFLGNWINNKSTEKVNEFGEKVKINYKNQVKIFKDYAAWSELDLSFGKSEITLNGISTSTDSLNHFLSVFDGQEPVRFEADKVLPQNTSSFYSYTFSDKQRFFKNMEEFFTYSDFYYKREERIKKIESGFRTDIRSDFTTIVKNEIIVATTSISKDPANKTSYFILHTEGKSAAEEKLNALLLNYANRKKIDVSSLKLTFSIDKETPFVVYRFPYPSFPGTWMGKPFTLTEAKFVAFWGNFMVFCNSQKGIEEYLRNMVLDATLDKDMDYIRFKQNIENKTNINTYYNVNLGFQYFKEIFNPIVFNELEGKRDLFQKMGVVNWQVLHNKQISFNSMFISFDPKIKEKAKTTWQSNVGSNIISKPVIVVNHNNPTNREIILQDSQNTLHQVTKEGRTRWSIDIPETILSEIYQIDYYKNGRLQYLFNTKSKLFLIDRNGENVAHFPLTFRSPATNGVNIFDYDNNRNYRFFVACENKRVYAYDNTGKLISGWEFDKTDHEVTTPVQHFRVGNNDYIVFKDKSRVYIQDRRGKTRVATSARFENSRNPLVLNLNGKPKIVATDKNGKVFYLYFDGKFSEKKTEKFSEDHFFTVEDLNGNGVPDFVFIDKDKLIVMSENGEKSYSWKFENEIQHKPNIYTFGPNLKKVGVVDTKANQIYLFNAEGKLHDRFPLQGNGEFSIGKISQNSGQLNLIVGSVGGNLYNYTLN
ncbi:MAG: hypothetical protein HOA90_04540 [Prolixibacteraceae bacterium]|nr:hypothetical protein [Prolixibacteraceae bacterium]